MTTLTLLSILLIGTLAISHARIVPFVDDIQIYCPPGEITFVPHPTDCTMFFFCLNGESKLYRCSEKTHWDIDTDTCIDASLAKCGYQTPPTAGPPKE